MASFEEVIRELERKKAVASSRTVKFYTIIINLLRRYAGEAEEPSFDGFLAWLRERRGWSLRSVRTVAYHLKAAGAQVRVPRVGPAARSALSEEEVKKLLAAAREQGFLIYTLVGLLALCGLRASEALALRWGDIDFQAGVLTVREGKGMKARKVPIPAFFLEHLKRYKGSPSARVIPRSYGWAWETVRRLGEEVLGKPVTCHVLRHTYATLLVAKGVDVFTVKELLGHGSVATTTTYLHHVNAERARSAIEMALGW